METPVPSTTLVERVARLTGAVPRHWQSAVGGHTAAGRWVVRLEDGSSVFVKAAATPLAAGWLRDEHRIYRSVSGRFLPVVRGWDDDSDLAILILEDLSAAHWPPPWSAEQITRLRETLAEVAAVPPPDGLMRLEEWRAVLTGWCRVAADPGPFLSLGLCGQAWLDQALPELLAAERAAALDGDRFLHMDVRSDNVCFAGDRVVLIDWNWACVGNPRVDIAAWLPSLHAEGGPPPEAILPGEPELAALMSGYFASHAGLPSSDAPPHVRPLQRLQLSTALPWAVRALSLPALR
jgi:hypothetical protein